MDGMNPGPEGWARYLARNATRTGVDTAAGALGAIPDLVSALGGLAGSGSKALTGYRPSEIPGIGPLFSGLGAVAEGLGTESLRNAAGSVLPEGFLEPQGYAENLLSKTAQTAGSLVGPGGAISKVAQKVPFIGKLASNVAKIPGVARVLPYLGGSTGDSLGRAAKLAAGSHVIGDVAGAVLGEGAGEAARIGSLLALSTVGTKKGIDSLRTSLYKTAQETLPKEARVEATAAKKALDAVEEYATSGAATHGDKVELNRIVKGIGNKITNGMAPVKQLWEAKKEVNKYLNDFYELGKGAKDESVAMLVGLRNGLNDTLAEYGKVNPEWGNVFQEAEAISRGIEPTSRAMNFINKWIPNPKNNSFTKVLLRAGLAGIPKAEKSFRRLTDPTIRKYYLEAWRAAAEGNKNAFIQSVSKFDKYMKESQGEGGYFIEG